MFINVGLYWLRLSKSHTVFQTLGKAKAKVKGGFYKYRK